MVADLDGLGRCGYYSQVAQMVCVDVVKSADTVPAASCRWGADFFASKVQISLLSTTVS